MLLKSTRPRQAAATKPAINPSTIELIRKYLLELRLKNKVTKITMVAKPKFSIEPKVPFSLAKKPPPQAVIPTLMRLIPIKVTTIPETSGVIILRVNLSTRLINISTVEAAITAPKIEAKPPAKPALIIGEINENEVP